MKIFDTLKIVEEKNNLSKDLWFLKLKKYIEENEEQKKEMEKSDEELNEIFSQNLDVSFDDNLTLTMEFIQSTANQVSEWEIDTMKGYIALKKIEKTLKKYLKPVWELARDVFWNYDKNDLPYGGKWTLQLKTTIDYKSNPIYSKDSEKLKEFEAILKNAVEQNKKGNVVCDNEWNVIDVPEYKMSETLVIKWI